MFCLSSRHGVSSVPCIVWSTVSMSFYCRNTYLYWEYLIPFITVILSHRALLNSELEKNPTRLWVSTWETAPCWGPEEWGRGEENPFSRAFGLHWAWLDCPSFPNEGCTQRWASLSAVACKQDHCSLGEMSCWNGQYLWHKLTWRLNIFNSIVALCHVDLKTNKSKPTLTLGTAGNPSRGCSISVWKDQG